MNKLTYASEYVDELIEDSERQIKLRDEQISVLKSRNAAYEDIIGRLVGQYSASGLHAIQNSLNPAQSLLYDALQVMKGSYAPLSAAITSIMGERQRQQLAEGWTPEHDDEYTSGEMAGAASAYARHVNARSWVFEKDEDLYRSEQVPDNWPWANSWWKPTNPRRDLVKAGALITAEIERIDRAAGKLARKSDSLSLAPQPVERNECGMWTHPVYSALFGGRDGVSEAEFNSWCKAHSIVSALSYLDSEDGQDEVRNAYFNNGLIEAIALWNPKPPEGEGWFLGSIHDSEEGPVAVWFRSNSPETQS